MLKFNATSLFFPSHQFPIIFTSFSLSPSINYKLKSPISLNILEATKSIFFVRVAQKIEQDLRNLNSDWVCVRENYWFVISLQAILSKGAKYLVVQGLPPTGCLTLAMALAPENDRDAWGCVGNSNKQSYNHNTILQAKLNDLRKKYPDAVIVYADYWDSYISVLKDPKKYGIKELFKACCGSNSAPYNFDILSTCGSSMATSCPNPSEYINWDGVHLTEAMYKAVADSFLLGKFCQPPFEYLLSMKRRSG